ncbi:MAG TPA: hypothetical protein VFL29_04885 [Candidatus Dormibacteraeota bacterium]|nr:hypothetical protein [Candidatus Dormibacteraeota bacterium]
MLRETVVASAAIAASAILGSLLLGQQAVGVGLAAGLIIGSLNGHALAALMVRGTPLVASTVVRLAAFSAAAIGIAFLLRSEAWAVLLGVGAAQAVMVVASIRQGLRA